MQLVSCIARPLDLIGAGAVKLFLLLSLGGWLFHAQLGTARNPSSDAACMHFVPFVITFFKDDSFTCVFRKVFFNGYVSRRLSTVADLVSTSGRMGQRALGPILLRRARVLLFRDKVRLGMNLLRGCTAPPASVDDNGHIAQVRRASELEA